MSETHLNTRVLPVKEAAARLEAFTTELTELVKRYELHCIIFSVGISSESPEGLPQDQPGVVARSGVFGCIQHALAFAARNITELPTLEDVAFFVNQVNQLAQRRFGAEMMKATTQLPIEAHAPTQELTITEARQQYPPAFQPQPADIRTTPLKPEEVTEADLLHMPLPKEGSCKN